MPEVCLINGRRYQIGGASIPIDDWAFRYGWGLFETIRIHKHTPLFLDRHVRRLCGTAPLLELGDDSDGERIRWRRQIAKAVRDSRMRDGIINCYWTRGSVPSRVKPAQIIRARPMPRYPARPVKLWLAPWRIEPTYPGTGVKTLAYFPHMYAGLAARKSGFDEALVLNTKDRVADGAASSVFLVHQDRITTPRLDQGTLAGVTRSVVIEIAKSEGSGIREASITWKSLLKADAIFITSSLRGVVAVSRISSEWKSKHVDNSLVSLIRSQYAKLVVDDVRRYQQED